MNKKLLLPILFAIVAVVFFAQLVTATPPNPVITAPTDGATVSGTVEVKGTAAGPDFGYYKVEFLPPGGTTWVWVDGTVHKTPVTDGTLAKWDTSKLPDGAYGLRVLAADKAGQYNTSEIKVNLSNAAAIAAANAPRRGCMACHTQFAPDGRYSLAYEAIERMEAQGKEHPTLPDGFKTTYATCMTCHAANGIKPMSSIVHPAHMFSSNIFIEEFAGNCFSCHEVKNGKFDVLVDKQDVNDKGVIKVVAPPAPAMTEQPASGGQEASGPPNIPANHPTAGCVTCHGTGAAGAPKFPANHASFTETQCATCHQAAK